MEDDALNKMWGQYMEKLGKSGIAVQSSAATQIVGKAKAIKVKRAGNHASFVGGYKLLEGKNMKAIHNLSKICPHLTVMDGTIEILPVMEINHGDAVSVQTPAQICVAATVSEMVGDIDALAPLTQGRVDCRV